METNKQDAQLVEAVFEEYPQLNNTLAKMVLTDSRGQHKDQKSAERLGGAQRLIDKQSKKATKEAEKSWAQQQDEYLSQKVDLSKYMNKYE